MENIEFYRNKLVGRVLSSKAPLAKPIQITDIVNISKGVNAFHLWFRPAESLCDPCYMAVTTEILDKLIADNSIY